MRDGCFLGGLWQAALRNERYPVRISRQYQRGVAVAAKASS